MPPRKKRNRGKEKGENCMKYGVKHLKNASLSISIIEMHNIYPWSTSATLQMKAYGVYSFKTEINNALNDLTIIRGIKGVVWDSQD